MLKGEQIEVGQALLDYLMGDMTYRFHLVLGYAGTGKTFVISRVIEEFLGKRYGTQVAMTAPTNKAVKVLRNNSDVNAEYMTIHQLLGLKPQITKYGSMIFVEDRNAKKYGPPIENFQVLIIDEVSMLDDFLFRKIMDVAYKQPSLKIIFMGDECQIPPVTNSKDIVECAPMRPEVQDEEQIAVHRLTTIHRQGEGSAIIDASVYVRQNLVMSKMTKFKSGYDMLYVDEDLMDKLFEKFASDEFKEDGDYCKVIAWTNKTVDRFNAIIRKMIFGDIAAEEKVLLGEKLIANTVIHSIQDDLIKTSEEMLVKSVKMDSAVFSETIKDEKGEEEQVFFEIKFYKCVVICENELDYTIRIIHESSEEDYKKMINYLAKNCRDGIKVWSEFYYWKDKFADVKYNYAITAHKSQGSTYRNTFLILSDIESHQNVVERNRILYTAMTRSKDMLFIVKRQALHFV